MIWITIMFIVLSIVVTFVNLHIRHQLANDRKSAAERRRREKPQIVAFLKCLAKVLCWNERSEDSLSALKDDNDPRASKTCYLVCRKNCKGFGSCPATKGKALSKEGVPLSAIGGMKVKERFINDDGSFCFVLDDRSDENVSIRGAWILYDNGDSMALPRTDPGNEAGNAADKTDYVAPDSGDPFHE